MSERRTRAGLLLAVAAVLLLAASPAATFAAVGRPQAVDRITIADVPDTGGEDCVEDPNANPGVGLRECPKGFDAASLLPFAAGGVVILIALGVGWYLVMRRRAARPFLPDEMVEAGAAAGAGAGGPGSAGRAPGDWWTCRTCGASNMVGVARCYKCGAWPR